MSVRGGSLCIMFKLNTLHPLDRIRGHAQPDMLPTPRPGRVLLPPGAEKLHYPMEIFFYTSCCASGCAFIGYAVPRRHGCALAIPRQYGYIP